MQKVGSRKRTRSLDQGKRRSRSKSDDQKRSRDARHGKKRMKHRLKSTEDAGQKKNSLKHSRKRSGSQKRSRSPEQKRKARQPESLEAQQSHLLPHPEQGDSAFGLRKQPPPKKKSDQTQLTLNDRFSRFHDGIPIVLDESISIEIERNIDGDEPFVIPNFHPHEVHLPRRNDEGRRSLTSRTEFALKHEEEVDEEYSEKRVVTVMKSRGRESDTVWHRLGQASRGMGEAPGRVPTLFWKDLGRETVIQVPIITSDRGRDADSEVMSANDHFGRRVVQTRSDPEVRRSREPQFRNRRRFPPSRDDPDPRQANSQDLESRFFRDSNRRFDPQGRRQVSLIHWGFPMHSDYLFFLIVSVD